jgi:hypothetical protein
MYSEILINNLHAWSVVVVLMMQEGKKIVDQLVVAIKVHMHSAINCETLTLTENKNSMGRFRFFLYQSLDLVYPFHLSLYVYLRR